MAYTYKYPRPAVTADCIVITKETEPKVLLIQRSIDPFKGCWAFPGGFMDMDETTEQCAIRELMEETGLHVSMFIRLGHTPRLTVTQEAEPSLLPISLSSMSLLQPLAKMMQPKQNGGHFRICHIWHSTTMTLCKMR